MPIIDKLRSFSGWKEHRSLLIVSIALSVAAVAAAGYFTVAVRRNASDSSLTPGSAEPAPPAAVEAPAPQLRETTDVFKRNQTITEALLAHGFSREEVYRLVQETRPVYNLAKVRAGREYKLRFSPDDGRFHDLVYRIDEEHNLTVSSRGGEFVPEVKEIPFDRRVVPVTAEIDDSLFLAVTGTGEQDQLALDLAQIFMWDVDFYTDIQKGDSFRLLVEKRYLDGEFDSYGNILAAEITVQNKSFSGFRFEGGYYGPDGKSLKKSFLKSPLKFTRISSRFSRARRHPILKIVRPHLGIDYAAPTGTPVVAVASGKVVSAGRRGGYGKSVQLRHNVRGYETMYNHLSRIAVRRGTLINQGQVIGYVGATGLATGPHLDFRLIQHGKFINPATAIFPPAAPVSAEAMPRFRALVGGLEDRLLKIMSGVVRYAASEDAAPPDKAAAAATEGFR